MITPRVVFLIIVPVVTSFADDAMIARSREASMRMGKTLKSELMTAVESGGPAQAVEVCFRRAPALGDAISAEMGLTVRRVAGKARNPGNQPDAWEADGLALLATRIAEGADPATAETHAWIYNDQSERKFRYMKAIVTEPLCLACHGPAIEEGLAAIIKDRYPDDTATGFLPGSLRGAFSVSIKED